MSAAVASASVAPLPMDRDRSPKGYPTLAPSSSRPSTERHAPSAASRSPPVNVGSDTSSQASPSAGRRSPMPTRIGAAPPKIIVKKEPPSSPTLAPNSRHRPRKLDLSTNIPASSGGGARTSAGPLTAGGSLVMHDVGLACLSPGFQTQDPNMREQLQRSISVRDQQRSIIEARLQKTAKGDGPDGIKPSESAHPFGPPKQPSGGKKRPPPAGLSIVPPSAQQFANERVIQSAPLNQTFTGRHDPHPMTRQVINQPSNLSSTSHIHHVPAMQTSNRLPPIADVFGSDTLAPHNRQTYYPPTSASDSSHSNHRHAFPSPGMPPSGNIQSGRPRDYRSAEEAVQEMAGGREDLLPRIVHYGGHQPPTPPSPLTGHGLTPQKYNGHQPAQQGPSTSGRRRTRAEYEGDSSPALSNGRDGRPHGPFGAGRDSPDTQRRKKDEFLSLCARAWDLFHN